MDILVFFYHFSAILFYFLAFLDPKKGVKLICIVSIPNPIYFDFDTYLGD
jgi:hypothetical protein